MLKKQVRRSITWQAGAVAGLILLGLAGRTLWAADRKFDTLRIGGEKFTNVTVLNTTKTDVFIQHAAGLANFKVNTLDPQVLAKLTGKEEISSPQDQTIASLPEQITSQITGQLADNSQVKALQETWMSEIPGELPPITKGLIAAVLGAMFAIYFFFCYCCKLIVEKAGHRAGFFIWVPILQIIPLQRAAGMADWWFLLWLLPFLNIIASVVWCFKIVEARGKSVFWAVLLLLPLTNLLAILYLAFSAGETEGGEFEEFPLARAA